MENQKKGRPAWARRLAAVTVAATVLLVHTGSGLMLSYAGERMRDSDAGTGLRDAATATPGVAARSKTVSLTDEEGLVTVEAGEGILPEGSRLSVEVLDIPEDGDNPEMMRALWEAAQEDLQNFLRVYAYDIRFYDAEGMPVLPSGKVKVTFHDIDFSGSGNRGLYHISDDNTVSRVPATDPAGGGGDMPDGRDAVMSSADAARNRDARYGGSGGTADVTFRTSRIGIFVLAMDSGTRVSGSDHFFNISVGETILLESEKSLHYGWICDRQGIVEVRASGDSTLGTARTARVTGLAPGTVTITHYHGLFGAYTETFTVTVSYNPDLVLQAEIAGSELAYVRTHNGSYSVSGNEFVPVRGGETVIRNYLTREDPESQILFFVKPEENHILVDLGEGPDKYAVSEAYGSGMAFEGKANWEAAVKEASGQGYLAYFGYTRDGLGSNRDNMIRLRVRSLDPPAMEVTAVPSKTEGVSLGDRLDFEIRIEPHTQLIDLYGGQSRTIDLTVEDKEIRRVTVNGQNCGNVTENPDGTFTVAGYTATAQDCRDGEIRLEVDAAIHYGYLLGVKDRNGSFGNVKQTAVVEKSATAVAAITKSNFSVRLSYKNMTHPNQLPEEGDKLSYTARVQNNGDVLRRLSISDSRVNIPNRRLSVNGGEATSVIYTYTVTEADILAGRIVNTVTVKDEENGNTASDTLSIGTAPAVKRLRIDVRLGEGADQNRRFQAGDTVPISVVLSNTGTITQRDVSVAGTNMEFTAGDAESVTVPLLSPGSSVELPAYYTVTQEDIDEKEQIVSSAEARGIAGTETDPQSAGQTFFHLNRSPGLAVGIEVKNRKDTFDISDEIQYEVVVSNTGNTRLDADIRDVTASWNTQGRAAVDLSGAEQSGDGTSFTWDKDTQTGTLHMEPYGRYRFRYIYKVTEEDITKQCMTSTVTVKERNGRTPEASAVASVYFPEKPGLDVTVVETSRPDDAGGYRYGEEVTYSIRVSNTGNVMLADVTVSYSDTVSGPDPDPADGSQAEYAPGSGASWKIASLGIGEENARTFAVRHTVTEEDITAGEAVVRATAETGYLLDRSHTPVSARGELAVPTVAPNLAVSVEKEAAGGEGFYTGDVIPYLVTVRNAGNRTTEVIIEDTFDLSGAVVCGTPGAGDFEKAGRNILATLKPGASAVVSYSHTVTEEDILRAGKNPGTGNDAVVNTVTVRGVAASEVLASAAAYADIDSTKTLSVRKELSNGKETEFRAGETAEFNIIVTNRTGEPAGEIRIEEESEGAEILPGEGYTVTDGKAVIPVIRAGGTAAIAARYTVTQEDIDRFTRDGAILKNTAAVYCGGTVIRPCAVIPLAAGVPGLELSGEVLFPDGRKDYRFSAGETAEFEILVKNTGDITLEDIEVDELLDGAGILQRDGLLLGNEGRTAWISSLAPDESAVIRAEYEIKQEDVDTDGSLTNRVRAYYAPGSGRETVIEIPLAEKKSGLSVSKTVTNPGGGTGEGGSFRAGDEVHFDISVTNEGTVTLRYLIVNELLEGAYFVTEESAGEGDDVSWYMLEGRDKAVIARLSPGQTATLRAAYRLTQEDVDANGASETEGQGLENTVSVRNGRPEDPNAEGFAGAAVSGIEQRQSLVAVVRLTNRGSGNNGAFRSGDEALFDIILWNSGSTTQENVTVTELLDGAEVPEGSGYTSDGTSAQIEKIKPASAMTVKAAYTVTDADIEDKGELRNTLVVHGGRDNGNGQTISAVIPKDVPRGSTVPPGGSDDSGDPGEPGDSGDHEDSEGYGDLGGSGNSGNSGGSNDSGDFGDTGGSGNSGDSGTSGGSGNSGTPGSSGNSGDSGNPGDAVGSGDRDAARGPASEPADSLQTGEQTEAGALRTEGADPASRDVPSDKSAAEGQTSAGGSLQEPALSAVPDTGDDGMTGYLLLLLASLGAGVFAFLRLRKEGMA